MNHEIFCEYSRYLTRTFFEIRSGKGLHLDPQALPCFDLITVLDGKLEIGVDKRVSILQKGQSALIFPHQVRAADGDGCRYHRCLFSDRIPISFSTQKSAKIPTDFCFTLSAPIMELLLNVQTSDPYYAQKGLLYLICNAFNQGREYVSRSKTGDLTVRLLIYVDHHFKNPLLEQELAMHFDYDHSYLRRIFRSTTGIQFKKYLQLRRLEHARYLLECSEFSILRCAEESGFSCLRSFNRIFKAHFGQTPKEHRNNARSMSMR